MFNAICIPVLLTHNSAVINDHTAVTAAFLAAFEAEVRENHRNFAERSLPAGLTIHLFLFPMKRKADLVRAFDERLKGMPSARLNFGELRTLIADPEQLTARSFEVVHDLACLANTGESELALQELVLRCLEQREVFNGCGPILDSLVRRVGLFPYLEPASLDTRDRIAYELHRPTPAAEFVFHSEQAEVFRSLLAGRNVVFECADEFRQEPDH